MLKEHAGRDSAPAGLPDLWRLGPAEVVAAVGAGGKSSLLEVLARHYEREGARVLVTTTTKVRPPASGGRPLVLGESFAELAAILGREGGPLRGDEPGAPRTGGSSPLVGRRCHGGKVEGLPSDWIRGLRDLPGVAAVLVEADGSAGRPLKAPAAWEPVVPDCAGLVVGTAGLDAQGAFLDEGAVHRPELLAGLLGLPLGSRLPPAAPLLALERGYAAAISPPARFLAFLNKADVAPPPAALRAAAARAPFEVWTGSVGRAGQGPWWPEGGEPVLEVLRPADTRPAAIVLAAGLARRMGGDKVLAALGGGTVLGRVGGAAVGSGACAEVIVVAGVDTDRVGAVLRRELPGGGFRVAQNPHPERGMASSLHVGVRALSAARDVLVLLGDQPFVTAATIARLLEARRRHPRAAAVGLEWRGSVRPPVVLYRSLLPQILELTGDRGARSLLERYAGAVVGVPAEGRELLDIDEPGDLARARTLEGGG
ncbi:MAG: selenium cofactor biosynthesis protein YqeC [Actinobacteria bacterium]|nr:selenium cofactor biosynthesis protein YqeC [Actinomycetota bacterium]